ncbi:MAG TPA: extracellular solute-binding protein [Methylomirabilota bacterium]|nr:extracellular solute-binding protein [Methylomirabilota bacterium]
MAIRVIVAMLVMVLGAAGLADAQPVPGATPEERAINGAKAYLKKHNLKNVEQTILLSSLYNNSFPDFSERWEKLTGIKIKIVPLGYTDIPAKIMAEAVAKTGQFDMFNDFPYIAPDAAGAGVIVPLDGYAERGKPDFAGVASGLRYQQHYQGKLYLFVLDGDHLILVLRQDLLDNPQVKAEYKAKFKKDPGCPATMEEWEQMAAFFHTKPGQKRWGMTFDNGLYGAMGYRSINFSYRHFPAYFGGLLFDKDMKPRINTPHGIQAIKQFASIVKYMPPDIQGWGTPQIYPFWASGQAFSVMSFPSIVGFANSNEKSLIKGKQLSCLVPQTRGPDGKVVRRSPQAAGTGYMVSKYGKHPELAYWFIQWFTGPTVGDEAIAHPKGFWDPFRESNLKNAAIRKRFGEQFLATTMENSKYATSLLMIEGNYEYFNVLDKALADVMNNNTSAEEAAKRIETGWNKVTDDVGRSRQIQSWRQGVESGIYLDKF